VVEDEEIAGTPEEEEILSHLSPSDPMGVDELAAASGFEAGALQAALLKLEIESRVRQLPGSRFIRRRRR
jgi:predicted Rossmann fold nucleotide-binding protein DprA/Smf involved in DNA uptake